MPLIGIILVGLGFLERRLTRVESGVKTAIKKIKEATFRANSVVQGLLDFARPSELKTEKVRPKGSIDETLSLLKYKAPLSNIKIETHISDKELYIIEWTGTRLKKSQS